jgi:hypothetical protein
MRILKLQPSANQSDPIYVSFKQGNLHYELQGGYSAISYTWGTTSARVKIYCIDDNSILWITPNLSEALAHFRNKKATRWLWADVVCINQENDKEKSSRILTMAEIYRYAYRVLVWHRKGS